MSGARHLQTYNSSSGSGSGVVKPGRCCRTRRPSNFDGDIRDRLLGETIGELTRLIDRPTTQLAEGLRGRSLTVPRRGQLEQKTGAARPDQPTMLDVTEAGSLTEQGRACVSPRLGSGPALRARARSCAQRASPEGFGWHRLTSDICGEYARKLLRVRRFRWSRPCRPWTVNPSRKLRRFESFTCHRVRERAPDQRKRRSEALRAYLVGVSKLPLFWRSSGSAVAGL